jgi:hypothetical protein
MADQATYMLTDAAERAKLLESARHRAERLVKALDPTQPFPAVVTALFAEQLLMTLAVLIGPDLFRVVQDQLFDCVTERFGICRFCNQREMRPKGVMCQTCWDQAEADDYDKAHRG